MTYALSDMAVYWLRHRSPTVLAVIGLAMIAVSAVFLLGVGLALPFMNKGEVASLHASFAPSANAIDADIVLPQEPYPVQVRHRIEGTSDLVVTFLAWAFWRAAGLMLLGMTAWKLRLFTAERSDRTMAGVGLLMGRPLVLFGVWDRIRMGWAWPTPSTAAFSTTTGPASW